MSKKFELNLENEINKSKVQILIFFLKLKIDIEKLFKLSNKEHRFYKTVITNFSVAKNWYNDDELFCNFKIDDFFYLVLDKEEKKYWLEYKFSYLKENCKRKMISKEIKIEL